MIKRKKRQDGFTIMEMIISLSIIALVSSLTLANYHESNQVAKINSETYKFVSLVREVQDWALGVKEDKNGNVPGAWGLEFTKGSGNFKILTFNLHSYPDSLQGATWSTYKDVQLSEGVRISDLDIDNGNNNTVFLIFVPPDPRIIICRNTVNNNQCRFNTAQVYSEIEMSFTDRFSTRSRRITINKFGLIDTD